jgi:hypothetical protein
MALCLAVLAAAAPAWGAPPPPGLVAAYSFDEGSGSVAVDASGNGHAGAIVGASWTASGRYGGALSFDGDNDYVGIGSLGGFYQAGFTLQAWVQKATSKNDVAVVGSWAGSGPMIWVDHLASRYHLTLDGGLSSYLDSGHNPVTGTWQHLAATYDGNTARFYIDGAEVASRAVGTGVGTSDVWRIGAYGSSPGNFFDGLVDDVRIYNRALSAGEIQADLNQPVTIAYADIPTTPGNVAVAARTKTSLTLEWSPSTDDVGISGYHLFLDGVAAGTTTGTTHMFTGLSCATSHQLGVEAFDADGNLSISVVTTESTSLCAGPVGLVAAYSFDDNSAADTSGNGHTGAITGASWVSGGRYGGALSFDGSDDSVLLGNLGGFYHAGFTLQAWVKKGSNKNDVAIVGAWTGSGPMLWVDHIATHYRLTLDGGLSSYLDSGLDPVPGQWQHISATYDGASAHYYIDGTEVASRPVGNGPGTSDMWRIGAYGGGPGGFFDGLIDDVRIYSRALTPAEIEIDMHQPVPPEDKTPPSAPGALSANGFVTSASLSWGAASDDVQLVHYNLYRSTTPSFTPSAANLIAQPTGTSYSESGVAAGTYYYRVTAEDTSHNNGPPSNEASATVAADTTAPTVAITAPGSGATTAGQLSVTVNASDDQSVVGVQFKLDGQNLGAEATSAPYAFAWDTRGEIDGTHTITAVARDAAGNVTVSTEVPVTISNPGVSTSGLLAAYGLDDGSGSNVRDSTEAHLTASLAAGPSWSTAGRFGGAVSFPGSAGQIDVPALGTFYKNAFTYEAWVFKQGAKHDVGVVGTWVGSQAGGAMIWIDHQAGRYRLTLGDNPANYLDSGQTPAVGRWQHLAATYDGATARIYVDGVVAASAPFSGNFGNSNTWRIGAYGNSPTGTLDGVIDNVRIYDRSLSATEIATNMASRVQPDRIAPAVATVVPANGAAAVSVGNSLTVRFNEPMDASTVTAGAFELTELSGGTVPITVSFDPAANVATLKLQGALEFGATYRAVVKAGVARDLAGNAVAELSWQFTTQTSPPPVLLASAPSNPFGTYLGEILRNEGMPDFTTIDAALITPSLLTHFDVVLLGEAPLSAATVTMLSDWVEAGGNLIAMRPDKQLAGLLGLSVAAGTWTNAYLKVDTTGAGAGIVGQTIQFHGTADRYWLNGATPVATLYSNVSTDTTNPAVTLRSVGASGGQAAAFTFDLARSVVYTRQGNPAWASQERDGSSGLRPSDMFFGGAAGDPQPDWLNTNKIAIPQADEQQRLLVNLLTQMNADRKPLPRFWYLPRGEKAVVVMSGDDHSDTMAPGGSGSHFDRYLELSPPGCVVANWECVRSTSYLYPSAALTNAQAASYRLAGFEIALHPTVGSCPTGPISAASLGAAFDLQLAAFHAKYTSVPAPSSNRTHCVYWPDWASAAKVESARGMRLDANYYHYPATWIGAKPGFMTGGGFPMRFADLDGTPIDVYQQNTNLTDESTANFQVATEALLDNALGPQGYYGAFGANMHTDDPAPHAGSEAIVEAAQARGVPVISYEQMLRWVDGRDASSVRNLAWSSGSLTFSVTVAAGANGLQTMLPVQGPAGLLSAVTLDGSPVGYTMQTIKGIQYALFATANGNYQATYS